LIKNPIVQRENERDLTLLRKCRKRGQLIKYVGRWVIILGNGTNSSAIEVVKEC